MTQMTEKQRLEALRDLCLTGIDDTGDAIDWVQSLLKMAGFMAMVAVHGHLKEGESMNKDVFFALAVRELNDSYDQAVASKETFHAMMKMTGGE